MSCPGCGKSIGFPAVLGTWHDHITGRLLVVYAVCRQCMDMLEKATPEERGTFTRKCEKATGNGRLN